MSESDKFCDVCEEAFDTELHFPRILSCGHVYCSACLLAMDIACPVCRLRDKHASTIEDLPIVYKLIFDGNTTTSRTDVKASEQAGICAEHKTQKHFLCRTCVETICFHCTLIAHPKGRHEIVSLKQGVEDLRTKCEEAIQENESLLKRKQRQFKCEEDRQIKQSTAKLKKLDERKDKLTTYIKQKKEESSIRLEAKEIDLQIKIEKLQEKFDKEKKKIKDDLERTTESTEETIAKLQSEIDIESSITKSAEENMDEALNSLSSTRGEIYAHRLRLQDKEASLSTLEELYSLLINERQSITDLTFERQKSHEEPNTSSLTSETNVSTSEEQLMNPSGLTQVDPNNWIPSKNASNQIESFSDSFEDNIESLQWLKMDDNIWVQMEETKSEFYLHSSRFNAPLEQNKRQRQHSELPKCALQVVTLSTGTKVTIPKIPSRIFVDISTKDAICRVCIELNRDIAETRNFLALASGVAHRSLEIALVSYTGQTLSIRAGRVVHIEESKETLIDVAYDEGTLLANADGSFQITVRTCNSTSAKIGFLSSGLEELKDAIWRRSGRSIRIANSGLILQKS